MKHLDQVKVESLLKLAAEHEELANRWAEESHKWKGAVSDAYSSLSEANMELAAALTKLSGLGESVSEISRQRRFEILGALKSTLCVCGTPKRPMTSHCRNCYYALPPAMRGALYRKFGAGYEEAYEESVRFLQERKAS